MAVATSIKVKTWPTNHPRYGLCNVIDVRVFAKNDRLGLEMIPTTRDVSMIAQDFISKFRDKGIRLPASLKRELRKELEEELEDDFLILKL